MAEDSARLELVFDKYPRLFATKDARANVFIPEGWLPLVDLLCQRLDSILKPTPFAVMKIVQIKEKFGEFRCYYQLENVPNRTISIDIDEAVSLASAASRHCCQRCGEPGEMVRDGGWMHVTCDNCAKAAE